MATMFEGTNNIQLRAKDDLGNWSPTGTQNVRIDTRPPGVSSQTYTSATDATSTIDGAYLWKDTAFASSTTAASWDASSLTDGDQSFSWRLENDEDFTSHACSTPTAWINAADIATHTSVIVRISTMDRNHTYDASSAAFGSSSLRSDSSGTASGTSNHKVRIKPAGGSYSGYSNVTAVFGDGVANSWTTLSKNLVLSGLNQGTTKLQFASKDNAGNWGYMGDVTDGSSGTSTGCEISIRKDTNAAFGSGGNVGAYKVSTEGGWVAYAHQGTDWINRDEATSDAFHLFHAIKLQDAISGHGDILYKYTTNGSFSGDYISLTQNTPVQTSSTDLPSGSGASGPEQNTNTLWGVYKLGEGAMGASTGSNNAANGAGTTATNTNIQVKYKYLDYANNSVESDTVYILLDRKPPTLTPSDPESGSWNSNAARTVSFTLTDDDSGIDVSTIKYAILGTESNSEQQLYSAAASGSEGSWTAIGSQKLHISTGAIASFDASAWVSPTVTGSDGDQTVSCVTGSHYWNTDSTSDQARKIIVYCEDIAGNPSYHTSYLADTYNYTISFGVDATAPAITDLEMLNVQSSSGGTTIANNTWVSETNPVFEWGASDPQGNNITGYSAILLVPGDTGTLLPDETSDSFASDGVLDTSDEDETPTVANGWGTVSGE